ncbi:MAG: anti-sigma factor [Fuscovulum sp.]|nr:MAG: anti-sigma factor [Fuscovulum sp.]
MTTEDTPLSPLDADDALAAEYVLGVLSLADRSAVEARLKNDSAFVARVAAWENRLAPLNDDYAEVPAPDLLPRIEARLFPVAAKPARRPLFGWLSGAATAAAIAIGAVVMFTPPAPPPVVATLGEADASLRFEARFDGQALTVTRVAGTAAPEGQVQQLWIIAPDAAPVSLGLLEGETIAVPYPEAPAGWTLAVSVEPAGGSPTGAPTGPVVAAGVITDL